MDKYDLKKVLKLHELWLADDESGKCANLRGIDLSGADLRDAKLNYVNLQRADLSDANLMGANLRSANLMRANLRGANLRGATLTYVNLQYADLSGADLRGADLRGTNLSSSNLSGADLRSANLTGANLSGADLSGVIANAATAMYHPVCPTEGSFVGYKKCRDNVIVKLLIPEDAKRSSATTRKCRCDKAFVLEVIGGEEQAISQQDETFVYKVGETVSVDDFDHNRWNECSTGIHFFITREEAEAY